MAYVFDDEDLRNHERYYAQLLSRGYSEDLARRTATAQMSLAKGTAWLARYEQGLPEEMDLEEGELVVIMPLMRTSDNTERVLLHDNVLLPEWKQFAGALSSATAADRGYVELALFNIQLSQLVSEMLLQSFQRAPLRGLLLGNNNMGGHGINFAAGALENNPRIERLFVASNHIESARDAESLVSAVKHHPSLDALHLYKCHIGQNNAVMSAIAQSLYYVWRIDLRGNSIESHGAILIWECLRSNPHLTVLDLDDNLLNDGDAKLLAKSLKTNTNLRSLHLCKNHITQAGTEALTQTVYSRSGLSDLYNSNHTCSIIASEDGEDFLSKVNDYEDPGLNRKFKILNALISYNSGCTSVQSLDDVPVKIMPTVLAFLQDEEVGLRRLEALFRFIKEWNMPLLFKGAELGPKLQRSERIRKRKYVQLM